MGYLLMHIWLCLLAAALLGGLLMWLVSRLWSRNLQRQLEALWSDKLRNAEARSDGLQADLIRAQDRIPALEKDKVQLSTKLMNLGAEHQAGLAAAAAAAAAASLKFSTVYNEKRELEGRLEQLRKAQTEDLIQVQAKLAEVETAKRELEARGAEVAQELETVKGKALTIIAERDRLQGELTEVQLERGQLTSQVAELTALRTAPMAMAAAASATAVSTPQPILNEWEPKFYDLQRRFQGFVAAQQKEGYGDIERIEGIGPVIGQKLRQAGIAWVKTLLSSGATAAGRKLIVEQTALNASDILKWVNAADLLRIEGVTPDWAEMLEVAGVDTVKELRNRVPENLHRKMVETRAENARRFHSDAPALEVITEWIETAKTMEPVITH